MMVLESTLAKKYAVAFFRIYRPDEPHMKALTTLRNYLSSNKVFKAILNLPSLSRKEKEKIVDHVAAKLQLPKCIIKLIKVLLQHKRIELIDEVVNKVFFLHKKRERKFHFAVSTSHELTPAEQEAVTSFIKTLVPNHIVTTFTIDPTLISGIKIKSDTLLLERSIAKQLRNIEKNLVRQD